MSRHKNNFPSRPKTEPEEDFWDLDSDHTQPFPPKPSGNVPQKGLLPVKPLRNLPLKPSGNVLQKAAPTRKSPSAGKATPSTGPGADPTEPLPTSDPDPENSVETGETPEPAETPEPSTTGKAPPDASETIPPPGRTPPQKKAGPSPASARPKPFAETESTDDRSDQENEPAPPSSPENSPPTDTGLHQSGTPTPAESPSGFSLLEKISLLTFLLLISGALVWGAILFLKPSDWKRDPTGEINFPVAGTHATLAGIESWWRKPIRSGENLDPGIRPGIRLIPEARITLSGDQNGAVRFVFQDDRGQRVGDPVTLTVENGRFLTNGKDVAQIICTEGFTDPSLINVYAQGELKPWELLVYEAENDRSNNFQLLLTHEISSQLQP